MKELYDRAGGKMYVVHHTDAPADPNAYQVVLSAVTGKLTVPVWFILYGEGGGNGVTQTILLRRKTPAFFYIRQQEINTGIKNCIFENHGFANLYNGTSASDIELWVTPKSANWTWHLIMGYYLVDL